MARNFVCKPDRTERTSWGTKPLIEPNFLFPRAHRTTPCLESIEPHRTQFDWFNCQQWWRGTILDFYWTILLTLFFEKDLPARHGFEGYDKRFEMRFETVALIAQQVRTGLCNLEVWGFACSLDK
jgi:hypothetical protein